MLSHVPYVSLHCRVPLMAHCPPERRYATYKAFYYPQTPASYEPPHFRPADSEADRYFFSTHRKDEVPERWSVGRLEAGWNG
jgi:meiosis-specific protein HOP1